MALLSEHSEAWAADLANISGARIRDGRWNHDCAYRSYKRSANAFCSISICVFAKHAADRKDEMRNTLVITGELWIVMILLIGSALAQNLVTTPPPPMTGPVYDFSTGYTYLAMPFPGAGQTRLNGLDASGSIGWNKHWGATLDANVFGTPEVPGTAHQAYVLNTQCGPEFYPLEHRNTRFFVRALAGSALIDASIPAEGGSYHGWLLRPSLAFGGGFEQSVSRQFGIRFNADYLRTLFSGPTGAALPQNNLRLTVSLVIRARKIGERVQTTWY
jgi:hypothetical protein